MVRSPPITPPRLSIARQAALRLLLSLGLFVSLISYSSYHFYSFALEKAAQERAEDIAAFYRTRLMQLNRDWELQAQDFKVRLEVTRLLEQPQQRTTSLQAFMTVQGTNRHFEYFLIEDRHGGAVFEFGASPNVANLPTHGTETSFWHHDAVTGNLYSVFVVPVWLGETGMGRMLLFYKVDNELLFNLATPGITLAAIYAQTAFASSAGQAGLQMMQQGQPASSLRQAQRDIPWSLDVPDDQVSLRIDAPIKVLFSTTELVLGVATIPLIDGLILWFTLGLWLMRHAARIRELGGAVEEFSTQNRLTEVLQTKIDAAKGAGLDEISEVSHAVENLVELTLVRELERKEEATRRHLWAMVFSSSNESVVITDHDNHIVSVNDAFTRLTGYAPEEVIGNNPRILSAGQQSRDFYVQMWQQIHAQDRWSGELLDKRKDGSLYFKQLNISVVRDERGEITNYIGIFSDITERRQTLEKLRNTAAELAIANAKVEEERALLAERVEQRTAQLREANHAKDSFLATMSHEIRTPLGGLLGMMELLELSSLSVSQREMLQAARGSGNSLLRIVNDILDWSKIEAGKLELAACPTSLAEMLQSVLNTYAQLASEKSITLELTIDPNLAPAHDLDALRVSQILNNFVSNALKFTARGKIHLRAERLSASNGMEEIRLCVQDSGIGIDHDKQRQLFQNYAQASVDTARMYGGTGLGLAICRRLAELMNGKLSLHSEPGVGSTFCLEVSFAVAQHLARDSSEPADALQVTPLSTDGRVYSLLIVDDHPLNRMLLKQQLELLGVQVAVAADGIRAIDLWRSQTFDLIISDCHMPEMDGYELARQIRALEQHSGVAHIPIIAWTANVMAQEIEHCRAAGMDDVLTKPTDLSVLREKLSVWLL